MYPNHEKDFYGWAEHTVALLRAKRFSELDLDGILEEIESMGASEKRELISRLAQLIFHLLKWQLQPERRGRSWEGSIETQREELQELFMFSPSLKNKVEDFFPAAYKKAKSLLKKETPINLSLLSQNCPYSLEQILDDEFFPKEST